MLLLHLCLNSLDFIPSSDGCVSLLLSLRCRKKDGLCGEECLKWKFDLLVVCVYRFHLGFTTVSHILGKTAV